MISHIIEVNGAGFNWGKAGGDATLSLRAQVRSLHADGLAAGQIAARLGLVLSDVLSLLAGRVPAPAVPAGQPQQRRRGPIRQNPHGKLSPAQTAERNERIAVAIEAGERPKAIAKRLGIGRTTVQHICQSLRAAGRLPPKKSLTTDSTDATDKSTP